MQKQTSMNKRITLVIVLAVVALVLGIVVYVMTRTEDITLTFVKDTETIEFGETFDTEQLVKETNGVIQKYPTVDSSQVGTQALVFVVERADATKEFTFPIEVKDTKGPEIKLKQDAISFAYGASFQIEDILDSVVDPVDGALSYSEEEKAVCYTYSTDLDTTKAGSYVLNIKAIDQHENQTTQSVAITVEEQATGTNQTNGSSPSSTPSGSNEISPTYIKGILLVNKTHPIPRDFGGGLDDTAYAAFLNLQAGAKQAGYDMPLISGYRSYDYQANLYANYVAQDGQALADTYSARPGTSEHQTGLGMDVGQLEWDFGETAAG